MITVTYLQPRNWTPGPDVPALEYDGKKYQSGAEVQMPAVERDRLSNWILFESEKGEEVPEHPDDVPPGTSTPADTVSSVGMGRIETDQSPDQSKPKRS